MTVALPEDRGRQGDARPKVHRFRSHWLELGRRLRAFRARYGLTQDEVAVVVGAKEGTALRSGRTAPMSLAAWAGAADRAGRLVALAGAARLAHRGAWDAQPLEHPWSAITSRVCARRAPMKSHLFQCALLAALSALITACGSIAGAALGPDAELARLGAQAVQRARSVVPDATLRPLDIDWSAVATSSGSRMPRRRRRSWSLRRRPRRLQTSGR